MEAVQKGEFESATKLLRAAVPLGSPKERSELRFMEGSLCVLSGDVEEALSVCERGLEEMESPPLLVLKGKILAHKSLFDEAVGAFKRAIELDSANVEAFFRLGMAHLYSRKPGSSSEAYEAFCEALKSCGEDDKDLLVGILFGRASASKNLGKWDDVLVDAEKILELEPSHAPALHLKGQVMHHRGEHLMAIAIFTECTDACQGYFENLNHLLNLDSAKLLSDVVLHRAASYIQAGDFDMVYQDSNLVLRIEGAPYKDIAHHYRAKVFSHHKQWWKAIDANKEALKLNPKLANAYLDISNAYMMLGKEKEAEDNKRTYDVMKRATIWKGEV